MKDNAGIEVKEVLYYYDMKNYPKKIRLVKQIKDDLDYPNRDWESQLINQTKLGTNSYATPAGALLGVLEWGKKFKRKKLTEN